MLTCTNLRTEFLIEPRGIATPTPEFTWSLESDRHGDRQTACEVEVDALATTGEPTAAWRPGRLPRLIGESVVYAGDPLGSRHSYRWRVRVWDGDGQPGEWSMWASFEMGVLAPDGIEASWITGGGALRRELAVGDSLVRARAYVSGLGYYEFHCNGERCSTTVLASSFTEFGTRVEYEILDLTPRLTPGTNCVGFLLADGWWRHGSLAQQKRVNQGLAEIVLDYADGRREVVRTDASWKAAHGPLLPGENESPHQVFDGVALDLAWLADGWCKPGALADGWEPARLAGEGIGALVPSLLPPIREVETLRPFAVKRLSETLLSIDFGQNFTGHVRFRANTERGARFIVRHAELLQANGRLNGETLRSAQQVDTFLLAGTLGETVEPRFLHHGFRYVEIEGPIEAITSDSIEAVIVHSDVPRIGQVTTSDPRINWLLDAVRWTVRSNAMSVMTDVCQRDERRGWLMDGLTGMKAGLLFYDFTALARKWLDDMIDNQETDGSLRGDQAPLWFPCKSVGWQRAVALMPLAIHEVCGDRHLLERAFPYMQRYADYLIANLKDDLLPNSFSRHPVEWLCIGKPNDQLGDNAVAVDVLHKVAQAAEVLGESGALYLKAADRMVAAAHQRWHQPGTGIFGGNGGQGYAQSNQVYALRFGLAAVDVQANVFDSLVTDLMESRGEGPFVTTGIGSTEHLPFVLSEFGRDDLVWKWLQRDTYPSYGFMQNHGATAIWECWEQRTDCGMNAHNHTGLSGIGTWLMQRLVGIRVEPGPEPHFHLNPAVHLPLDTLTANWSSRWGVLKLAWEPGKTGKHLTVTIPPGCAATLCLAADKAVHNLTSGNHEFSNL